VIHNSQIRTIWPTCFPIYSRFFTGSISEFLGEMYKWVFRLRQLPTFLHSEFCNFAHINGIISGFFSIPLDYALHLLFLG